jgi:hypothetical protein
MIRKERRRRGEGGERKGGERGEAVLPLLGEGGSGLHKYTQALRVPSASGYMLSV